MRIGLILLAVLLPGACAPPGLEQPRVLAGGPTTVSIEGGQWSNADAMAERHCAGYGRRAVPKGRHRASGKRLTNVFIYDCKDENR